MKIKVLILIAFVFVVLTSCTKDTIVPKKVVPVVANTSASFSKDVFPVFAKYSCLVCHSSGMGGLTLTTSATTTRANLLSSNAVIPNSSATSKLYTYFNGASHSTKTLTTTEVSNIKGWIDAGAKDN